MSYDGKKDVAGGVVGLNASGVATLASPILTGTPTAPTAASGTSTTQLATTAFVAALAPAYSNLSASGNVNITSPYLLTTQSIDGTTMRLPDASTTLFNAVYTIYLTGSAQNATITVPAGQYLNNVLNGTYSITATPNAVANFRSNAANYWVQIDDTGALALKAPLASPVLTGTPAAPTAASGTNSTQLATTAYIDTSLATFNNINGLKLSWASSTTLGLTAGYWNIAGSSIMRTLSGAVTINIANVGVVNGLDTGSAANSTNYYVYIIGHGTTPALNGGILSTSSTTPTLPSGYTTSRYIGRVRRDGSGVFIPFIQTGNGTVRTITYTGANSSTQVITGGVSTSYAAVSLANFVAPSTRKGRISFDYSPAAAGSILEFRETGSTVTSNLLRYGTGVAASSVNMLDFICSSSQSIDYKLTGAGDTTNLYVASYEEEL